MAFRVGVGVLAVALAVTALVLARGDGDDDLRRRDRRPDADRRPPTPVPLDAPTDRAVAGARHHGVQPEPVADLDSRSDRVGALAGRSSRGSGRPSTGSSSHGRSSQPDPGGPPVLDAPSGGCMRDKGAVRAARGRARPAASARRAPDGRGWSCSPACRRGRRRASRLPAQHVLDRRRPARVGAAARTAA